MIGLFDSGIGGLTVAAALRKRAPMADFCYFADLAHLPFGSKTEEELSRITDEAVDFLCTKQVTGIVAACNSVSLLVSQRRAQTSVPLIEMSEPTVAACRQKGYEHIGVIATPATVRAKLYENAFLKQGVNISSFAIPDLASAIERHASAEEIRSIIQPAVNWAMDQHIRTLLFGCTQFPFARAVFSESFAEHGYVIALVDPAEPVAEAICRTWQVEGVGKQTFYLSKDSEVFCATASVLFPGAEIVIL